MKTLKPMKLGILTRCFEHYQKFHLGVSLFAFVPLGGEQGLLSEVEMWKFAAQELGKDAALDVGVPKVKPEFLVSGSAFVPGGEAKPGCSVRVRLGAREKELYVFGDRFWNGASPSEPVPFTSMPIDWQRAYGGEGFDQNPLGKGFKEAQVGDLTVKLLPNVLYPSERVLSPDSRPAPAGFGPVDFSWPQRFSKAGTHDDRWLKEDFPGYARDIDWTIFNTASPDQWFDEPLKGDEPYEIQNMHPEKFLVEGRLPGLVPRCFINRGPLEGDGFEEIPTRLTTVWFFPHRERAILIYHGATYVQEEDAGDVSQILIGCEKAGEPKGIDHYRGVLVKRMDKDKGHLEALKDSDLLPSGMNLPDKAMEAEKELLSSQGLLQRNQRTKAEAENRRARELTASFGLNPDEFGPPLLQPEQPVPEIEDLPEFARQVEEEAEAKKKELEAKNEARDAMFKEICAQNGMDYEAVRAEQAKGPLGPPKFSAAKHMDLLAVLSLESRNNGVVMEDLEGMLADPEYRTKVEGVEAKLKEVYLMTAHHQGTPPSMEEEKNRLVRAALAEAVGAGESIAGRDLTGADLSGLDLQGADFEGAFLESVNFEGANLKGANLKNAVLAHASLEGAILDGAGLEGANLGAARLKGMQAVSANLGNAVLSKSDLSGACFRGARLEGADLSGAILTDADLSDASINGLVFLENDLKGVVLKGVHMDKCSFLKTDVTGVDFSGAVLTEALFLKAKGRGARFTGATMTNVRFVEGCDFEGADFTDACLDKANLRGSRLSGCDFSRAHMDGADLSESTMQGARLHRSVAREARFVKADLSNAVMTSLNAMNTIFQRADLRGADLRGANLFQADLARVHADAGTQLTDALTTRVRIYPKRNR